MITRHLIITGRVQGVGYRNYMAYKARQFQITGWVRNRSDGSVEAVIQGTAENVEALIVRAHRGPPKASVTAVKVSDTTGEFAAFVTRATL
jgi:acylphosphatase